MLTEKFTKVNLPIMFLQVRVFISSRITTNLKGTGLTECGKGREQKQSQMVSTIKGCGRATKRMERGRKSIKMDNFLLDSSKMTQKKGKEFGTSKGTTGLRVSGGTTRKTVQGSSTSLTGTAKIDSTSTMWRSIWRILLMGKNDVVGYCWDGISHK